MLEQDNELLNKFNGNDNKTIEESIDFDEESAAYLASNKTRKRLNRMVSQRGKTVSSLQKMGNVVSKSSGINLDDLQQTQQSSEPVERVERVRLSKDLEWIKDNYGEKMVGLCRDLFPHLLEIEGLLPKVLNALFHKNKFLADDVLNQEEETMLKGVVYNYIKEHFIDDERVAEIFKEKEQVEQDPAELKTAKELLDEAGYDLYECKTDEDIMRFEKYFAPGERLCTFNSVKSGASRLRMSRIWFAVKKNADKLKREDFPNPDRQDEYGTSVISIQFTKDKSSTLKITNRYNHTVKNCDNTFKNNLDNIIPGLTDAFERDYGVREKKELIKKFDIDPYIQYEGKYYRWNAHILNVYYCNDNVIIDARDRRNPKMIKLEPHCVLADYFIFNTKTNTIKMYDESIEDCFIETFGKIEKIEYKNHIITIKVENGEDVIIELDSCNSIISLKHNNVKVCGNNFLSKVENLSKLEMKNLKECGDNFLYEDRCADKWDLPSLESCGSYMGYKARNKELELNAPNLSKWGDYCFDNNRTVGLKFKAKKDEMEV